MIPRLPFFVPQQEVNGLWQEFFGFDKDSPYLHARAFETVEEARAFLLNPSIWSPDVKHDGFHVEVVQ